MAEENEGSEGKKKNLLEKLKEQKGGKTSEGAAGDIFSGASSQEIDGNSDITEPKLNRATDDSEEAPSSDDDSSDSESTDTNTSEDQSELSVNELISKLSNADLKESDREVIEDAIEAKKNRDRWKKKLTQKSQDIAQLRKEAEDMLAMKDYLQQNPTKLAHFQEYWKKLTSGEVGNNPTTGLLDEVELPERIKEDDEAREFHEGLMSKIDEKIGQLKQENQTLRMQLSQASNGGQQADPGQTDPEIQKETLALSGKLDQLKEKYPTLQGPDGEEKQDRVIDFAIEQSENGLDLDLEQAFLALYPSEAKETIAKSERDALLKEMGRNGTVLEDTGEDEEDASDQSPKSLKEFIREKKKNSSRASYNDIHQMIKSQWKE